MVLWFIVSLKTKVRIWFSLREGGNFILTGFSNLGCYEEYWCNSSKRLTKGRPEILHHLPKLSLISLRPCQFQGCLLPPTLSPPPPPPPPPYASWAFDIICFQKVGNAPLHSSWYIQNPHGWAMRKVLTHRIGSKTYLLSNNAVKCPEGTGRLGTDRVVTLVIQQQENPHS